MRIKQFVDIIGTLDRNKRIKFQNSGGWDNKTMAINAIIEEGNAYIFLWVCHPKCLKDEMTDTQSLVWYNPNLNSAKLVKDYFPDYTL